jgi:hypothetical protein
VTVDVTNALSYIDISYVMSSALYEYFLAYYNIVSFMTSLDFTSLDFCFCCYASAITRVAERELAQIHISYRINITSSNYTSYGYYYVYVRNSVHQRQHDSWMDEMRMG